MSAFFCFRFKFSSASELSYKLALPYLKSPASDQGILVPSGARSF